MLTEQEIKTLNILADSFIEFCQLDIQHQDDARDFADAIHICQRIVMGRAAVREYPELFPKRLKYADT